MMIIDYLLRFIGVTEERKAVTFRYEPTEDYRDVRIIPCDRYGDPVGESSRLRLFPPGFSNEIAQ